jgi:hypothetical protein
MTPAQPLHTDVLAAGGLALSRYLATGSGADLAEAVGCVRALPEGLPDRSTLAAGMVFVLVRLTRFDDLSPMEPVGELLAIADRHPPGGTRWPSTRRAAFAGSLMLDVAHGRCDPHVALARLGGPREPAPGTDADPADVLTSMARKSIGYAAALRDGDIAALREVPDIDAMLTGHDIDHPMLGPVQSMLRAMRDVVVANEAGDAAGRSAAMARARTAADTMPPGSDLRRVVDESFAALDVMEQVVAGGSPTPEQVDSLRRTADGSMFDDQRILGRLGADMAEVALGSDISRERMDRAVRGIRDVLAELPDDHPLTSFALFTLGLALMRRYEVFREAADLVEMADVLDTTRALASSPGGKLWSQTSQMLAYVTDQRGGDPAVGRDLAVTGLRGFAWSVLLQTDVAAAATAAREAASEAMETALRCLRDDAVAQAVTALDAGRGLTLFAATEIRDVAARLDAIGRADLADQWRAATARTGERVPLTLRQDVLTALAESDSARLLDPPGIDDIQAALATLDADALVYLTPSRNMQHGMAVVVPAQGSPGWMMLPDLMLDGNPDVDRYLDVMAARSASDEVRDFKRPTARDLRANLDRICGWAWRTAIGPVLHLVAGRTPVTDRRPRRLVLVPMGDLARVPWHAARNPDSGAYAIETAAFSYAASARMLCESARRDPVPLSSLGLVVGDPDAGDAVPDLPAARAEAYAVRQVFYNAARYVGRRPDGSVGPAGAGRRAEVVSWLTSRRPTAGALLHLACHGVSQSGAGSYLLLAGGETLTAEELVGLLADHPDRNIGLVVLAACRSGVSTHGYDEAYSLGTTFVAAGVRTVLSTQWSIPDQATSLLMFMFHHYLRAERRPAWDALRRAQTWMLDPDREPPASMPPPLREQLHTTRPEDVLAWAGFVHLGQ